MAGSTLVWEHSHWDATGSGNTNANIAGVTLGGTAAVLIVRASSGNFRSEIWAAYNVAGSNNNVVVVAGGVSSSNYLAGGCKQFAASAALTLASGLQNTASGSGTAPAVSTNGATTQASALTIATVCSTGAGSAAGLSGPTGWTPTWTEQDNSNSVCGRSAYREETVAGVKTATFASASAAWIAAIAVFNVGSGGGDTPNVKRWNGSAWVDSVLKRWNGSAWVKPTAFRKWNGTSWVG